MNLFTVPKFAIRKIREYKCQQSAPLEMRHDDVYLVSFPRSGNIWLSFMLANLMIKQNNLKREVNIFNIREFIPDIYVSRYIPQKLKFEPFPRIIKSHEKYNLCYKRVIWLIRDPRDVMVSYWHFYKKFYVKQIALSDFIRSKKFGIRAWIKHTKSWLNAPPDIRIVLVKYEDLKRDPKRELLNILKHLGILVSEEIIDKAVEESSFEKMKRIEKETRGYVMRGQQRRLILVGKGEAKQRELSELDQYYIKQKAEILLRHFNYL